MRIHKVLLFLCQVSTHNRMVQYIEQPFCMDELGLESACQKDGILRHSAKKRTDLIIVRHDICGYRPAVNGVDPGTVFSQKPAAFVP